MFALVHGKFCDRRIVGILQRVLQKKICFLAFWLRRHVVRGIKIQRIDFVQLYKFQNFHGPAGVGFDLVQLVVLEKHILIFIVFVAFYDFLPLHFAIANRTK